MSTYAAKTQVSPEKSRMEIEQTLRRYGADAFGFGQDGNRAIVTFRAHGRAVRFLIPVPTASEHRHDHHGYTRTEKQIESARAQAERQRWRAMLLMIKAKLEAVESGIVTFEEEFAIHVVLPDNTTVGEWLLPQIQHAYETGDMPALLPGVPALTERTG